MRIPTALKIGDFVEADEVELKGTIQDVKKCFIAFCPYYKVTLDPPDAKVRIYYHDYIFKLVTDK